MNKENMERLAVAVETNARLRMSHLFFRGGIGANFPVSEVTNSKGEFCGTACCIAGEGALLF